MIFNSAIFLFGFLPVLGLVLFFLYRLKYDKLIVPTLLIASICFYVFSSVIFGLLLLLSIIANFCIGKQIDQSVSYKKHWLIAGILFNIADIFFFKYTGLLSSLLTLFGDKTSHVFL